MKIIKRALALAMAMMLCLAVMPTMTASALTFYTLGSHVDDFTLTTSQGETWTLSEVLKEKDMVLLNLWATWCPPCEMEFPFLQEAYTQYQDRVEVIAVSVEDADTDADLLTYAADHGLTFPVARDTADLGIQFYAASIPTTAVIDRFGNVGFLHSGALTSADQFTRLFDAFVGEEYTESRRLSAIPTMRPSIPHADAAKLAEALNPDLTFANPSFVYTWPMIPAEVDDRLCVMSTNAGADGMDAAVSTTVQAKAGDVLAVTFKMSSESACDLFRILVDDKPVKVFSGDKDWMTYAHAFEADGEYAVTLQYVKDALNSAGEDAVYIDEVVVLSGKDAETALAANPDYPLAAETTLAVTTPGARQITFEDPTFAMVYLFGLADYYIVPGQDVTYSATLAPSVDPEGAFILNYYDSSTVSVASMLQEGAYRLDSKVDSMETTGYTFTYATLYPAADCASTDVRTVVVFASEENVNEFLSLAQAQDLNVTGWNYLSGAPARTDALVSEGSDAPAHYTLSFMDVAGEPIPGVIANICDDSTCTTMVADDKGVIEFEKPAYAYEIHIIKAPEGYVFSPDDLYVASPEGGELPITLPNAE